MLTFVEYGGGNFYLPLDSRPNSLSRWLASQRNIVLFQWPVPDPSELPGPDPVYVFESTNHWTTMVNGYSGFYPKAYLDLLGATHTFPTATALHAIRGLGATHIVVHPWHMTPQMFDDATRILSESGLVREGCLSGPFGLACVFRLGTT